MSGEQKSSNKIFHVQDLQIACPTCHTAQETSIHDAFVYQQLDTKALAAETYEQYMRMPMCLQISQTQTRYFEDQLKNNPSSRDTAIIHCGTYSLAMNGPGVPKKKKYKIGQPIRTLNLSLGEALTRYRKLYTNNLYENIHDEIYPLPLGIYRKEIADFKHLRKTNKEHLCYANFSITHTYRDNVIRWANPQKYINCHFTKRFSEWDQLLDEEVFADSLLPFDEFLSTLASHKFCIAPNGVGIDTDRLWECIFMNVVPIVQNNYGNRIFSKIWPMILVDMYEVSDILRLTAEFEKKYGNNIQYNHDLLLRENLPELMERIQYECKMGEI